MSDQIEKIESGRWLDGRYISLPFTPEQVAINALIDHIHALEKRVEGLEDHTHGLMGLPIIEEKETP